MDVSSILRNLIHNGGMSSLPVATQKAASPVVDSVTNIANRPAAVFFGKDVGYNGSSYTNNVWEWDYSEQEALNRAWQSDCFALDMNGWVDTPTKGMSREEYIVYRAANATGYAVDWDTLAKDLMLTNNAATATVGNSGFESNYNFGDDHEVAEYFAARFVAMQNQIENNYSGAERMDHLEKLERMFDTAVEQYADSQAMEFDTRLSEFGINGEAGQIKESYKALYNDYKASYTNFLQANANVLNLEQNAWLSNDDRYIAANLQSAYRDAQIGLEPSSKDLYSGLELHNLGVVLDEMQRDRKGAAVGSEEEIGVRIGHTAMKIETVAKTTSGRLQSIADKLIDGFALRVMDLADSNIQVMRESAAKRETAAGKKPVVDHAHEAFIDRKTVLGILAKIRGVSGSGGSISDALLQGVQEAKSSYIQRRNDYSTTLRYGSDSGATMDGFLRHYTQVDASDKTFMSITGMSKSAELAYNMELFMKRLTGEYTGRFGWGEVRFSLEV